jgi:purine nucleosidase/pyrimidine-specific ribonucleoside hydrolase
MTELPSQPQPPRPIPIVLDCDPGHDDAIALLLAVQSPSIDLKAVTTTFGNCSVEDATRNALRILTLAGATTVPVAKGASGSLGGTSELGNYVHGASGLDGPGLREPAFAASYLSAVEMIEQVLTSAGDPITLVATGPITNVATCVVEIGISS